MISIKNNRMQKRVKKKGGERWLENLEEKRVYGLIFGY